LGETLEPRSDVFTLGSVLFEMVTGKRPFEAEDSRTTAQRVRREAPPVLTRFVPDVKPSVDRLISRALSKFPADRFANAAEMRQEAAQCAREHDVESNGALIAAEFKGGAAIAAKTSRLALPQRMGEFPLLRDLGILAAATLVYFSGLWAIQRVHTKGA